MREQVGAAHCLYGQGNVSVHVGEYNRSCSDADAYNSLGLYSLGMMSAMISLALFALVLCHEGLSQLLDEKCVGQAEIGSKVRSGHSAPWMASIHNTTGFVCAGTLIHRQFVLTAAHCIEHQKTLFVHLGESDRLCLHSQCRDVESYNVKEAIVHRNFTDFTSNLGLLRLETAVSYKAHILPICITLDDWISPEKVPTLEAIGWGKSDFGLQTSFVTRRKSEECRQRGVICTAEGVVNSGGPLAVSLNYRGRMITAQFGIMSYDGSVHTDVLAFKDWIGNIVSGFGAREEEEELLFEQCSSNWTGGVIVRLWEVSLLHNTFTGSLITDQFVVTVASALPTEATPIKVETRYHQSFNVESIRKHPQFTHLSGSMKNNIALLKLTEKMPNSNLVKPICIGLNPKTPRTLTALFVANRNNQIGVRKVNLSRIDSSICSRVIRVPVESSEFCVEKPSDFIYDKPGSVLGSFQNVKGVDRYLLVGQISLVRNGLIVFTNIKSYINWIKETVI
ncbi:uncharacterized protein LOC128256561 isoform X3 [Drosophila gunungcola]|uniref:uncharacterized protein LOC128256561 isoform X3 n=1 Tax=Drosophila gunungcola TaxID=103775 RepID=UPI0022DFF3D9|nr:uncharacterized protein LOC128256561 isoform X3 [Drosophila gunungcola]